MTSEQPGHHHDHHHGHGHDHDHGHGPHAHPTEADAPDRLSYYQRMEIAVRELLIEKGILGAEEIHRTVEAMDARSPAAGARVVARAWSDPAFKERLLANGTAACEELGIAMGPTKLVVVENTPRLHNLIVCTLCSCYPRALLGLPPDWYKSRAYRSRAVNEPRAVLAEFGLDLPAEIELRVHDSTADMRYLVLPERPLGSEGMSEEALAALVSRDAMVGVATARRP
jgi:nitrile hydratase subunit alpha